MRLHNALQGYTDAPFDKRMLGYISILRTIELSDDDLTCLYAATNYLADHPDVFKKRTMRADVIFTSQDHFSLLFETTTIGKRMNLIAINHDKFRTLEQQKKIVVLLEEFVHHFWDTNDEIEVSRIVCEMVPGLDYNRENGNYIFG